MQDLQAYALKQEEASAGHFKDQICDGKDLSGFQSQPSSAPSSSVIPTLALTYIPANVNGENATNTSTKEPFSHTEGETRDITMATPISLIHPTEDKEEKMKKVVKETKLLAMSRPEVIKVIHEEAKKLKIDPKRQFPLRQEPPEGVSFVNNMVIEEPEYAIFSTDVFGDQVFQRWDDIHKLRKLITDYPDQEKLKSKKVKLEALGYHVE
nr:hypothetical protein [Tanacetum cinerariifolium]